MLVFFFFSSKRRHARCALVTGVQAGALPISMGSAHRWVAEDAFIVLRVVRHILAGHGPVFNVAEHVEAYTSPLWVAPLAAAGALVARVGVGAVVIRSEGRRVGTGCVSRVRSWRSPYDKKQKSILTDM